MAGKGSNRRPMQISREEWDANWQSVFKRAKKNPGKWTAVHPKFRRRQEDIINLPEMEDE